MDIQPKDDLSTNNNSPNDEPKTSANTEPQNVTSGSSATPTSEVPKIDDNSSIAESAQVESEPDTVAEPVPAAAEPAVMGQPVVVQPPKKSKLPWIIAGIVVGLLVILGAGGAYAYSVYQNPDRVILDAFTNHQKSRSGIVNAVSTSDFTFGTGEQKIALQKFTLNSRGDSTAPNGEMTAELAFTVGSKPYSLKASAMVGANGDMYFKIDESARDVLIMGQEMSGSGKVSNDSMQKFNKLIGKWVKYGIADIKKDDVEAANALTCALDVIKKVDGDKYSKEMTDIYQKNSFMKIGKDVTNKDGMLGYDVTFDKNTLVAFIKASESTTYVKDLQKCVPEDAKSEVNNNEDLRSFESTQGVDVKTKLWIGQWDHQLKKMDVTTNVKGGPDGHAFKVDSVIEFAHQKVNVATPSDTVPLEQWAKDAQAFYESTVIIDDTAGTATQVQSQSNVNRT